MIGSKWKGYLLGDWLVHAGQPRHQNAVWKAKKKGAYFRNAQPWTPLKLLYLNMHHKVHAAWNPCSACKQAPMVMQGL